MLKQITILICAFAFSFANEVVFSQSNPPRQKEVTRKWTFIANSDIFISQIETIQTPLYFFTQKVGVPASNVYYYIPNTPKLGFGVGASVALNEMFNLSFQYRYLRSGAHQTTETEKSPDLVVNISLFPISLPESNLKAHIEGNLMEHVYIADLMIQMSSSLTSKILIQPFAGIVTIRHNENFIVSAYDMDNPSRRGVSKIRSEKTSNGILIGLDIRFIINNFFYFFSSLKTTLTSLAKNKQAFDGFNDFGAPASFSETTYNVSQIIDHHWNYRFGVAFNHAFKDNWVLSLRIFTEMHSSLFENYAFGATVVF
ncbi:MAG: hypothetical protein K940chlam8_00609 [Chlamydiae bacterium]|nr:hypothetical protein [Chlamydiota bacterium]